MRHAADELFSPEVFLYTLSGHTARACGAVLHLRPETFRKSGWAVGAPRSAG